MLYSMARWALLQMSGSGRGRLLALGDSPSTLGRGAEANLKLADTQASRRHALLHAQAGGVVLKDLGSANGTFVRGRRITEVLLRVGDSFLIGQSRFYAIMQRELLRPGRSLGVWEIKGLLDVNAVSWHYRARQKVLEREVQLEVLRENFTGDKDLLEFYRNILRRVAGTTEDRFVPVFDLTEEDGRFLVARRLAPLRPIPWDELGLRDRARRLGEFLAILGRWYERGMTVPLGLDRLTLGADDQLHLSFPGALDLYLVRKKLHARLPEYIPYVSPEELAGGSSSGREESYRLGVLFYNAMTGEFPRSARDREQLEGAFKQPAPSARDLIPQFPQQGAQLLARLLSRHPQSRPTIHEVGETWPSISFPARARAARPAPATAPARPARSRVAPARPFRPENGSNVSLAKTLLFVLLQVGLFFLSWKLVYKLLESRYSDGL